MEILKNARARLEEGRREAGLQEKRFREEIREVAAYRAEQVAEEKYLGAFGGGVEVLGSLCGAGV